MLEKYLFSVLFQLTRGACGRSGVVYGGRGRDGGARGRADGGRGGGSGRPRDRGVVDHGDDRHEHRDLDLVVLDLLLLLLDLHLDQNKLLIVFGLHCFDFDFHLKV